MTERKRMRIIPHRISAARVSYIGMAGGGRGIRNVCCRDTDCGFLGGTRTETDTFVTKTDTFVSRRTILITEPWYQRRSADTEKFMIAGPVTERWTFTWGGDNDDDA